jgi:hypothetical protein
LLLGGQSHQNDFGSQGWVLERLGEEKAANVFYKNALDFYRRQKLG